MKSGAPAPSARGERWRAAGAAPGEDHRRRQRAAPTAPARDHRCRPAARAAHGPARRAPAGRRDRTARLAARAERPATSGRPAMPDPEGRRGGDRAVAALRARERNAAGAVPRGDVPHGERRCRVSRPPRPDPLPRARESGPGVVALRAICGAPARAHRSTTRKRLSSILFRTRHRDVVDGDPLRRPALRRAVVRVAVEDRERAERVARRGEPRRPEVGADLGILARRSSRRWARSA